MKKIFVPALLLGLIVPNVGRAVLPDVVPPEEAEKYVGQKVGCINCMLCTQYSLTLRDFIQAVGFGGDLCGDEMLNHSAYLEYANALRENLLYDAEQMGSPQSGELVNSYFDYLAVDMCNGISPAMSCMEYGMCICAANNYPYIEENGSMFCTACPGDGISEEYSHSITDCYLPSGTAGQDETGNWVYESNCHYQE